MKRENALLKAMTSKEALTDLETQMAEIRQQENEKEQRAMEQGGRHGKNQAFYLSVCFAGLEICCLSCSIQIACEKKIDPGRILRETCVTPRNEKTMYISR